MRPACSRVVLAVLLSVAPALGYAQADGEVHGMTYGGYLLVGAGVTDFSKKIERDAYKTGWTWDARLGIGNRHYAGAEVGYVGALWKGEGSNLDLLANGVEGVIRVQYPWISGATLVEPFVFGGIGWSHLSLRNAPTGATNTTDNIGVVPFGAGVTFGMSRLLVDVRFTYRPTFNVDFRSSGGGTADLKTWAVNAAIGWAF